MTPENYNEIQNLIAKKELELITDYLKNTTIHYSKIIRQNQIPYGNFEHSKIVYQIFIDFHTRIKALKKYKLNHEKKYLDAKTKRFSKTQDTSKTLRT